MSGIYSPPSASLQNGVVGQEWKKTAWPSGLLFHPQQSQESRIPSSRAGQRNHRNAPTCIAPNSLSITFSRKAQVEIPPAAHPLFGVFGQKQVPHPIPWGFFILASTWPQGCCRKEFSHLKGMLSTWCFCFFERLAQGLKEITSSPSSPTPPKTAARRFSSDNQHKRTWQKQNMKYLTP